MTLAAKNRLGKKELERVFKKGENLNSNFFHIKFLQNSLGFSRFGIVIGTRVLNKATARNKIKRQIRGLIKDNLGKIKPGFDIVLVAKTGISDKEYREIREDLIPAVTRLIKIETPNP